MKRALLIVASAVLVLTGTTTAHAAPAKPVRLVDGSAYSPDQEGLYVRPRASPLPGGVVVYRYRVWVHDKDCGLFVDQDGYVRYGCDESTKPNPHWHTIRVRLDDTGSGHTSWHVKVGPDSWVDYGPHTVDSTHREWTDGTVRVKNAAGKVVARYRARVNAKP